MNADSIPPPSSPFPFEQLRKTSDVKKWINSALTLCSVSAHTTSGAAEPPLSISEGEKAARALLNGVHLRSQQLSTALESQISQNITRLPRTTLELSRMVKEAADLHELMKGLESRAGSSSAKSSTYLARFNELKCVHTKLQSCIKLLTRAKEVEHGIKELDGLRSMHVTAGRASGLKDDVVQMADSLHCVKSGLEEIRRVETEFGSHFNHLLGEYEQLIQDQLEEQCLVELIAHNEAKASELFKTLYRIGRFEAVLQRFHSHMSHVIVSHCAVDDVVENYSVFIEHFLRCFAGSLSTEIDFWLKMAALLDDIAEEDGGSKELKIVSGDVFVIATMKQLMCTIEVDIKPKLIRIFSHAECHFLIEILESVRRVSLKSDVSDPYAEAAILTTKDAMEAIVEDALCDSTTRHSFCSKVIDLFRSQISASNVSRDASIVASQFSVVAQALCSSSDLLLAFFPELTVVEVLPQWESSLVSLLTALEVSPNEDQPQLLESLTLFIKQVHPSITQCRVYVSGYVAEKYPENNKAAEVNEEISGLMDRLVLHTTNYISRCQQKVKEWILHPLLEKAADYSSLPVWNLSEASSSSFDRGSLSATQPVRELGEAIIEIPVTLDHIRSRCVAAASNKTWMEEVIEDVSESWLDEVVCAAVTEFVEARVLPLKISTSPSSPAVSANNLEGSFASRSVQAWEQLKSDISYLRKVVGAVRDEGVAPLDAVYNQLQRVPPPSAGSFVVGDIYHAVTMSFPLSRDFHCLAMVITMIIVLVPFCSVSGNFALASSIGRGMEEAHVTFVSGNNHRADLRYWTSAVGPAIAAQQNVSADQARTDMLLWLGGAIRTNARREMDPLRFLKREFELLQKNPHYKSFTHNVVQQHGGRVDGTWDMQDFGGLSSVREHSRGLKKVFVDFLEEPSKLDCAAGKGLYHISFIPSSSHSPLAAHFVNSLCVISLDLMTSRSPLPDMNDAVLRWKSREPPKYIREISSESLSKDDVLGPEQWSWLESTIQKYSSVESKAEDGRDLCAVTLILSPWQILLNDNKPFYGWDLYPASRTRLLDLLQRNGAQRFIFLSGHAGFGESGVVQRAAQESIMPVGMMALYAKNLPVVPATNRSVLLLPPTTPLVEVTSSGLTDTITGSRILGKLFNYSLQPAIDETASPRYFYPRYLSLKRRFFSDRNFGTLRLLKTDLPQDNEVDSRAAILKSYSVSITLHAIHDANESSGNGEDSIQYEAPLVSLPCYEPSPAAEEVPQFVVYNVPGEYPSLKYTVLTSTCPEFECWYGIILVIGSSLPLFSAVVVFMVVIVMLGYYSARLVFPSARKTKVKVDTILRHAETKHLLHTLHRELFEVLSSPDGTQLITFPLECATVADHYKKTTGKNEKSAETCSTGLRVYEGAQVLASFLAQYGFALLGPRSLPNSGMCARPSVVELGCGCGLAGFSAIRALQHHEARVVFTDASTKCLELVRASASAQGVTVLSHHCTESKESKMNCAGLTFPLVWSDTGVESIKKMMECIDAPAGPLVKLILGSDIMYYRVDVDQLLWTINELLCISSSDYPECTSVAVLCHFMRIQDGRVRLVEAARSNNLCIAKVSLSAFLDSLVQIQRGWADLEVALLVPRGKETPDADLDAVKDVFLRRISSFLSEGDAAAAHQCEQLVRFIEAYETENDNDTEIFFPYVLWDNLHQLVIGCFLIRTVHILNYFSRMSSKDRLHGHWNYEQQSSLASGVVVHRMPRGSNTSGSTSKASKQSSSADSISGSDNIFAPPDVADAQRKPARVDYEVISPTLCANPTDREYFRAAAHGLAIGMLDLQAFPSSKINADSTTFSTQDSYVMHSQQGQGNSSELCGVPSSICMNYGSSSFFIAASEKEEHHVALPEASGSQIGAAKDETQSPLLAQHGEREVTHHPSTSVESADPSNLMDYECLRQSFSYHQSPYDALVNSPHLPRETVENETWQDYSCTTNKVVSPIVASQDSHNESGEHAVSVSLVPQIGSTPLSVSYPVHGLISITTSLSATGGSLVLIRSGSWSSSLSSGISLTLVSLSVPNPSDEIFSFPRALKAAGWKALPPSLASRSLDSSITSSGNARLVRRKKHHDPSHANIVQESDPTPIVQILSTQPRHLSLMNPTPSWSGRSGNGNSGDRQATSDIGSPMLFLSFILPNEAAEREKAKQNKKKAFMCCAHSSCFQVFMAVFSVSMRRSTTFSIMLDTNLSAHAKPWAPGAMPGSGGNSNYTIVQYPGQQVGSNASQHKMTPSAAKLFVGQLPFECTEERLRNLFSAYGKVEHIHILRDNNNRSRGAAFVTFSTVREADTAIFTLHNRYRMLTNRAIQVSYAKNSPNISPFGTCSALEVHQSNPTNPLPDIALTFCCVISKLINYLIISFLHVPKLEFESISSSHNVCSSSSVSLNVLLGYAISEGNEEAVWVAVEDQIAIQIEQCMKRRMMRTSVSGERSCKGRPAAAATASGVDDTIDALFPLARAYMEVLLACRFGSARKRGSRAKRKERNGRLPEMQPCILAIGTPPLF
eukprot:gene10469-7274_t